MFRLTSKATGVLQIATWIRLAANSRGRRHTSEEEVIEPRDTVSDIQTGIAVEVHSILATRRAAAEEQPVQQALRIGNVNPSIYITIVGNGVFINTKERHLVGSLARQYSNVYMGNNILHRLAGALETIDIPHDLGLGHVHLGERTPDFDPGDRLSA